MSILLPCSGHQLVFDLSFVDVNKLDVVQTSWRWMREFCLFQVSTELGMALHEMWEVSALPMDISLMKNTSHAKQNWRFWKSKSLLCSRPIESWYATSTSARACMAIIKELRVVRRVGRIIYSLTWRMPLKRLTGLRTRISSRGWRSMPRETLFWKKMVGFMRRVTFSGVFIIRPVNQCPESTFGRVFISLAQEMCGAISF